MMKRKIILAGVLAIPLAGGCTILGFLMSPAASEQKIPARFPLAQQKDKAVYLFVRGTQASGVDADVPVLLTRAIQKELLAKVKLKEDKILREPEARQPIAPEQFSWTQITRNARQAGAEFLLYTEIMEYELVLLHGQNYYMGKLTTRSLLLNLNTEEVVWPAEKTGRIVQTAVDFEKKGRSEILGRLTAATSHAVVRELYNCPRAAYWAGDEVKPLEPFINDLD